MHRAHRLEHFIGRQRRTAGGAANFVRQHVEQHFRVALGVGVAVVGAGQLFTQLLGVGQIAVVHHDHTKRCVHIERLRLFFAGRIACRGVAHLAQTHVARQSAHIAGAEHILDHALGFVHEELALLLGHDTGCILTTVLQQQQGVINQLIHGGG